MISVIIPCYNAAKTIQDTLNSLERQTCTDLEVIIINDGSTDNSLEVINAFKRVSVLDIKLYSFDNQGVSVARNIGIKKAKYNYICFLDSDDEYDAEFIKNMSESILIGNVDVACCYYKNEVYGKRRKDSKNENLKKNTNVILNQKELIEKFIFNKDKMGFTTFYYRKDLINEHNISFPSGIKNGEDLEFVWKYLCHCKSGEFIDKELYFYVDNPISRVHRIDWSKTDSIKAMDNIINYMEVHDVKFINEFKNYMLPRVVWSITKDFAIGNQYLFNRFVTFYDVRINMKRMLLSKQNYVKISSLMYLVHPMLFCYLIKTFKLLTVLKTTKQVRKDYQTNNI